eukprot:NODE_467_length_7071_cov_0.830752.p7 type:complete len:127 gc:universal NODE_467_length_7071_cov_0.830752:5273-4893(-)
MITVLYWTLICHWWAVISAITNSWIPNLTKLKSFNINLKYIQFLHVIRFEYHLISQYISLCKIYKYSLMQLLTRKITRFDWICGEWDYSIVNKYFIFDFLVTLIIYIERIGSIITHRCPFKVIIRA